MAASVKLTEAHTGGARACIVWDVHGKALVTAGEDARLLVHSLGGSAEQPPLAAKVLHQMAVTALCMAPNGHTLATASLDKSVKLYSYPGANFENNITRFTLPIRSLAFSITGGLLAAAGDDDEIKVISTADNSIAKKLKGHHAPVLSLAFDPKNEKLASVDSDGTVIFWNLESGAKIHCLRHAAPDVSVEEAGKNEIAWHPNGDVLAVPGHKFDVVMYDRETAEVMFRLKNCHNTAIGCLAWSPNGKYLATAGQDRKVMLWDTESKLDLDRLKVVSQVTSLSWKPTGNTLAMIDVDGKYGVWENAIPAHLPSPSDLQHIVAVLSRQELLHFSDDDDASDKDNSGSGDEDLKFAGEDEPLDDDDEDEEGEAHFPKVEDAKKKLKKSGKESDKLLKEASQLKKVKKEKSKSGVGEVSTIPRYQPCAHKPRPDKQAAFQPGSTQPTSGMKRFLAYSLLGCITSIENDGVSHVEVEFHDTSRGHRMPAMTDFNGFTMAALSEKGSILSNPQKGDKTPSSLVYRPCSSWTSNSEWSMRFPLGEEVRAVAVGDQWAAAATSLNYLRIYSECGLQKYVLSLAGPVVTMTSHQELLAVVTHTSDPLEGGEQVMEFKVFDVSKRQHVVSGVLPLTPGAKLTWLGFSETGTLSSFDSKGVLRMYSKAYGGCWIPVYGISPGQESSGENLWVVGLDSTQIFCVKCKAPDVEPQVNPKPVLSMVNFAMPIAQSDLGAAALENDLLCRSVFLAETRSRADEAAARGEEDDYEEDQILKMEAELDRTLLRLMAAACQGDRLARALELATMLSLHKSLEGAVKIVTAMHLPSLAERLNTMLEGRRNLEKSAAAAQASRRISGVKQSFGPTEPSALSKYSSLREALPPKVSPHIPPTRGPVLNPIPDPSRQPSQPIARESPRAMDRSGATLGNISTIKETEERRLQNGKSSHPQSVEKVKDIEVDTNTAPEEPAASSALDDCQPVCTTPNPFAKPSTSSNPFAKASNPFNSSNPSTKKQSGPSGGGEVSLLESLKKMQKKGTETDGQKKGSDADGKKKRKAKSSADKPKRPLKAAKEASSAKDANSTKEASSAEEAGSTKEAS
ncbi:unnamed protein product [Calypogeia fissa]